MSAQKVVFIDSAQNEASRTYSSPDNARTLATYSANAEADLVKRNVTIGTSALYAYANANESLVIRAISTLEQVRTSLKAASSVDPETSYFDFDSNLMRARALLSQAFSYREIGSGYAAVINAAMWSIANSGSQALSRRQLNVLDSALQRLISGPYLHFDTAMTVVDELEDAGLEVDPELMDHFFDTQNEE